MLVNSYVLGVHIAAIFRALDLLGSEDNVLPFDTA
jgi:hypothetical protein